MFTESEEDPPLKYGMGGGNESASPCEFDALRVREPANRESVAIYGSGLLGAGLPRQEQRCRRPGHRLAMTMTPVTMLPQ